MPLLLPDLGVPLVPGKVILLQLRYGLCYIAFPDVWMPLLHLSLTSVL